MRKNILTKTGFNKLSKKLISLNKKRKRLVIELEETRRMGDLTENSAYDELKNHLTILEGQIMEVEETLEGAKVVDGRVTTDGKIALGSVVKVSVSGRQKELEIVGDGEANPLKGKISYSSPIAQALLEKREGDEAVVNTPSGKTSYRILSVTN